jgi:hypothetical protein
MSIHQLIPVMLISRFQKLKDNDLNFAKSETFLQMFLILDKNSFSSVIYHPLSCRPSYLMKSEEQDNEKNITPNISISAWGKISQGIIPVY